jgi:hypothetical protein
MLELLVLLLRLAGAVMVTAFLAVLLPVDWMAARSFSPSISTPASRPRGRCSKGLRVIAFGIVIGLLNRQSGH